MVCDSQILNLELQPAVFLLKGCFSISGDLGSVLFTHSPIRFLRRAAQMHVIFIFFFFLFIFLNTHPFQRSY